MNNALAIVILGAISFGGGSTTATAQTVGPTPPPTKAVLPIALAGQSNARLLHDELDSALHHELLGAWKPGLVTGYSAPGRIRQWAVGAPDGLWSRLSATLHQPLRAFVWWQGEADGPYVAASSELFHELMRRVRHEPLRAFVWSKGDPPYPDSYAGQLREFIDRVRREAQDPSLRVVICRVVDRPEFARMRLIQEEYVRSDPNAQLVSSDGLPIDEVVHLTQAGYQQMARRVLTALSARP